MKRKITFVVLSVILIATMLAIPALAKENQEKNQNNGQPFQEIWAAITYLQNQINAIMSSPGPSQEEFDALVDRVTELEAIIYTPFFTSTPDTTALIGLLYTSDISASKLIAGDVLVITADVLPNWLELTDHGDDTATLAGIAPSSEDDYQLILRVTGSSGAFDTYECIIHVGYPTQPPTYPGQ
ncbi:hypothetical protein ACFLXF_00405 [Chloroflexota bacterium]